MLTLTPGSVCDVCAEEYGSHRQPHSISCGHVLCASCCTTIVEKTSQRLSPACPFCREAFTSESVRVIRMDFPTSGWSTPRRLPTFEPSSDFASELLAKKTERLFLSEGGSRTRLDARQLEDKVARIATQKCSVEQVSALHTELEAYLKSEGKIQSSSSLLLSAALLRAILMNHVSHSEASKNSKTTEVNLKNKVDDLESTLEKMEAELRRQRQLFAQKTQECQQLRTETNQLRALASTIGGSSASSSASVSASDAQLHPPVSPTRSSTSPTPAYAPSTQSPLSRYNAMHVRSLSMSSSRSSTPVTPSTPARSHTPAPPRSHTPAIQPLRSHTPAQVLHRSHTPAVAPPRSHTPAPALPRSHTPAPALPRSQTPAVTTPRSHTPSLSASHAHVSMMMRSQTPSIRSHTPSVRSFTPATPTRMSTPGPNQYRTSAPLIPPKPRRLSQTTPPKMMRSASEEKAEAHQLWIPPDIDPEYSDYSQLSNKLYGSVKSPSRSASYSVSSAAAARLKEARSPSPF